MTSLRTNGLESVKFKNSMKNHVTDANIVSWIVEKVNTIDNVESIKYNAELVLYVSSCIECACIENNIKTEKLDIFIQVYEKVFEMSIQDKVVITQMLDFLHKNNLIKGVRYPIFNALKKGLKFLLPSFLGL
jgi:hypothetical protein